MTDGLNIALNVDLFVSSEFLKGVLIQLVFTCGFLLGLYLRYDLLEHLGKHVVFASVDSDIQVIRLINKDRGRV